MNKDHIKGAMKDVAGKVEREVGKMTGDKSQQVKGAAHQMEGKIQKGVGDVKDAAHEAERKSEDKSGHH